MVISVSTSQECDLTAAQSGPSDGAPTPIAGTFWAALSLTPVRYLGDG
jgi:hypothetical protein